MRYGHVAAAALLAAAVGATEPAQSERRHERPPRPVSHSLVGGAGTGTVIAWNAVASHEDRLLVTWSSSGTFGNFGEVQSYSAQGRALGPARRLFEELELCSGGLAVAWGHDRTILGAAGCTRGKRHEIRLAALRPDGRQPGKAVVVAESSSVLHAPRLANLADGSLGLLWAEAQGTGGRGAPATLWWRRFAVDLAAISERVMVGGPAVASYYREPSLAALPDGGFAVAWEEPLGGSRSRLVVQRFVGDGTPREAPWQFEEEGAVRQSNPKLAVSPSGALGLVWLRSEPLSGQGLGLYLSILGPTGEVLRPAALLEQDGEGRVGRLHPDLAWSRDGTTLLLAWLERNGAERTVVARAYSRAGEPAGPALTLSGSAASDWPFLRVLPRGRSGFRFVWRSATDAAQSHGLHLEGVYWPPEPAHDPP